MRVWIVPDGLVVTELLPPRSSSSSSSRGIVHEDTESEKTILNFPAKSYMSLILPIEAERRLARLELPELELEDTEDTVDMVEIGLIVEVRPLRLLSPLSLLLWLWLTFEVAWWEWWCMFAWPPLLQRWPPLGCCTAVNPRWTPSLWLRLSRLFFQPREGLAWLGVETPPAGSEVDDLGLMAGGWAASKEGVLLEWTSPFKPPLLLLEGGVGGNGSSKEDSKRPDADVLGFGGGSGGWGFWFCCCLCCCLNFCTSSDVNWTVDVLPPRNFSHPGAPEKCNETGSQIDYIKMVPLQ